MIRQYGSHYIELSKKNPNMNMGIIIGTVNPKVLLDINEWANAGYARKKELLEEAVTKLWTNADGGIDTPQLLKTLVDLQLPEGSDKDMINTVAVLTDGDETGGVRGEPLKKMINGFNAVRMAKNPAFTTPVGLVFMGASLTNNGAFLHANYPCRVNIGAETTDGYLQALVQVLFKQVSGELEGDLSPLILVGDDSQTLAQQMTTALVMGQSTHSMLYSRVSVPASDTPNGGIDISHEVKMKVKGKRMNIDFTAVNIDAAKLAGFTFEFVEP